ncbi:YebC/PmpR family DNA-binding transcriptional regulator [Salinisphaera sp. USBA-960]|uniref:YebC/PmpR family DNA-binding transcriptional regulator n=1 Tax=Salinisphaera orenii TaxID=856731 RepID=UPI000DBEA0D8|nr:YebC/PmpR family DNA-binding transcriptional regulator [Salifodinibacter halophilus]NNC25984.1 YebC/PmpR family DNA-binding transcriptional regulator [Salifodinibacter halophilus]
MAGHSKWANIKHRKAAEDKKRGKIFTKLIREITVAAREGGGDPDDNPRLRLAWDRALANNMPKDTIQRAAERGAGGGQAEALDEVRYEGYGPDGAAIMIDCMTDNKNRTVSDVRYVFSRHNGKLGADGSVGYLFSRQGSLTFEPEADSDHVLEVALEAGADDLIQTDDGAFEVVTAPGDYAAVKAALEAAGLVPAAADVTMRPSTVVELGGDSARVCMNLLDGLEDLDDVQRVYTNVEFTADALAESTE